MRSQTHSYRTLNDLQTDRDNVAWYWQLVALAAAWMILGAYLILPATYVHDAELRFSQGVLIIIVVALMTAGYSFTALLCFACRSWLFQAESVFLPSASSSAIGLLTVLWTFASTKRFTWNIAAIVTTALAATSTLTYITLYLLTQRKINRIRTNTSPQTTNMWQESSFYQNFIANMYPSARHHSAGSSSSSSSNPAQPLTDEDAVNQQMAKLLMQTDSGPSPDASSSTFRIDLPNPNHDDDDDDDDGGRQHEPARSRSDADLYSLPPPPSAQQQQQQQRPTGPPQDRNELHAQARVARRGRGPWEPAHVHPRAGHEGSRGRSGSRTHAAGLTSHSRAVSREERRLEIERGGSSGLRR